MAKRRSNPDLKVCGGKKRNGTACLRPAGWGTDHPGFGKCKQHAGGTMSSAEASNREELNEMAKPIEVSPEQAVMGTMQLAAGQLVYASYKVGMLSEEEMFVDTIAGKQPNAWMKWQGILSDRVVTYAKTASAMGIAERQTSLAESQTELMAQLLTNVIEDVGLSKEQKAKLGPAIRSRLSAVAVG